MKKLAIIFSLFICHSANAEFQTCSGVLTNKPCSELTKKTKSLSKGASQISSKEDSKKESLIHELNMLSIKAKREYKLDYDIEILKQECKNSSLIECDKVVKEANKELQEMINSEKIIKLKKAQLDNKPKNENKTTIVIQNNNLIVPQRFSIQKRPIKKISPKKNFRSLKSDQSSSLPTSVR